MFAIALFGVAGAAVASGQVRIFAAEPSATASVSPSATPTPTRTPTPTPTPTATSHAATAAAGAGLTSRHALCDRGDDVGLGALRR